jgi:hypothetical protein
MEIYRATIITEDGTLAITGLPFAAGDKVEVIIRNQSVETPSNGKYPLRGTLLRFTDPFEPVSAADWEAMK